MNEPMPKEEMPAEKPAAAAPQQGGEGNPAEVVSAMHSALSQMNDSLQSSSLPPEALKHLQAATSEYEQFASMIGMPGAEGGAPQGAMPSMAAKKGAVPADVPTGGKGVRPVPAY